MLVREHRISAHLILLDGTPSGPWVYNEGTGLCAYRIPRRALTPVHECLQQQKILELSGIYLLFGESPCSTRKQVYVGQASKRTNEKGLFVRVFERHGKKVDDMDWQTAVFFSDENEGFDPSGLNYLEHHLYRYISEIGRYELFQNLPHLGAVKEDQKIEMNHALNFLQRALGVFSLPALSPLETQPVLLRETPEEEELRFYCRDKRKNYEAYGRHFEDGFLVEKGARLRNEEAANRVREELFPIELQDCTRDRTRTTKDILFSSPSKAASFVQGIRSVSGPKNWKESKTGKPMNEL